MYDGDIKQNDCVPTSNFKVKKDLYIKLFATALSSTCRSVIILLFLLLYSILSFCMAYLNHSTVYYAYKLHFMQNK